MATITWWWIWVEIHFHLLRFLRYWAHPAFSFPIKWTKSSSRGAQKRSTRDVLPLLVLTVAETKWCWCRIFRRRTLSIYFSEFFYFFFYFLFLFILYIKVEKRQFTHVWLGRRSWWLYTYICSSSPWEKLQIRVRLEPYHPTRHRVSFIHQICSNRIESKYNGVQLLHEFSPHTQSSWLYTMHSPNLTIPTPFASLLIPIQIVVFAAEVAPSSWSRCLRVDITLQLCPL